MNMEKTAIIIPTRLDAKRLPDKPLKLINNKEMILHVYDIAKKSNVDQVLVATPDILIVEKIKKVGGKAVLTKNNHQTGSDRVHEVFVNELRSEPEFIINLQGDMPNLEPSAINYLIEHIKKKKCDIATLASKLSGTEERLDKNVVKVRTDENLLGKNGKFSSALDFFRINENKESDYIFHHIGIYAFTSKALLRYVSLDRTKLEIDRKLEQLRALDNKMKIDVGYVDQCPLSVDTEEDLQKIKNLMEENVKN